MILIKILYFYEFIDWIGIKDSIAAHLGERAGIVFAGLLKMYSIWVVIPAAVYFVYLIIMRIKGEYHARKSHQCISSSQKSCRFNAGTSKRASTH